MYSSNRLMGQDNLVQERVKFLQIMAKNPEQIICFAGHRPGGGDFWATRYKSRKTSAIFGSVTVQMYLHEALYRQPQLARIKPRHVALYIALGL